MKRISDAIDKIRPFGHRIPRLRDRRKNPQPRQIVSNPPLMQRETEILRMAAWAAATDPEQAHQLLPLVWAESAIRTQENAQALAGELAARIEANNDDHRMEIDRLLTIRPALKEREQTCRIAYAGLAASLPMRPRFDLDGFDFAEDEPETLEATAARIGITPPVAPKGNPKLWISTAGAAILAVAYGSVTNAYEISSIPDHLGSFLFLFIVAFVLVMTVCALFETVGTWLGELLQGRALEAAPTKFRIEPWLLCLGGLCMVLVLMSEVTTERVGIYQSLNAKTALEPAPTSNGDLFWITTLVVVPTVFASLVRGLRNGALCVIGGKVVHERENLRREIRQSVQFRLTATLHQAYRVVFNELAKADAELARHRGGIRLDYNESEKEQLEDAEQDCVGASDKVEASFGIRRDRSSEFRRKSRRAPWWAFRLWRRGQGS